MDDIPKKSLFFVFNVELWCTFCYIQQLFQKNSVSESIFWMFPIYEKGYKKKYHRAWIFPLSDIYTKIRDFLVFFALRYRLDIMPGNRTYRVVSFIKNGNHHSKNYAFLETCLKFINWSNKKKIFYFLGLWMADCNPTYSNIYLVSCVENIFRKFV